MENFRPDVKKIGAVIGRGATADVFAYGEDAIVKVFHQRYGYKYCDAEWNCGVSAEKSGLPVPKNYWHGALCDTGSTEYEGRFAIIQERIFGQTLLTHLLSSAEFSQCLPLLEEFAALQAHMHRIDASGLGFVIDQKHYLRQRIEWAKQLTQEEKEKLYRLLDSLPGGVSFCHMDYHLDNVLVTEKGLVIIDWCDTMAGNATADLARTMIIYKAEAYNDAIPEKAADLIFKLRETIYDLHLRDYCKHGGHYENLEEWMAVIAAGRLHFEPEGNIPMTLRMVREYTDRV